MTLGALALDSDLVQVAYIVAFVLFIVGIRQGTSPKTARRGNMIAAVGMAVAVVATLCTDVIGNWGIILTAIAAGTAVGWIASARVAMTDMPQMVALYNGLGGGAVALIAWSEFRHGQDYGFELEVFIPILFSMVVGSISFWGSNIAFGKLQDVLPAAADQGPGPELHQRAAAARDRRRLRRPRDRPRGPLAGDLHRLPARRRGARQPLRPADRRRRHAGRDLAAQRLHRPRRGGRRHRPRQHGADRRRHARRLLGHDPHARHGERDEQVRVEHPLRRLRRRARCLRGRLRRGATAPLDHRPGRGDRARATRTAS